MADLPFAGRLCCGLAWPEGEAAAPPRVKASYPECSPPGPALVATTA